jgi:hypothetical protein
VVCLWPLVMIYKQCSSYIRATGVVMSPAFAIFQSKFEVLYFVYCSVRFLTVEIHAEILR